MGKVVIEMLEMEYLRGNNCFDHLLTVTRFYDVLCLRSIRHELSLEHLFDKNVLSCRYENCICIISLATD